MAGQTARYGVSPYLLFSEKKPAKSIEELKLEIEQKVNEIAEFEKQKSELNKVYDALVHQRLKIKEKAQEGGIDLDKLMLKKGSEKMERFKQAYISLNEKIAQADPISRMRNLEGELQSLKNELLTVNMLRNAPAVKELAKENNTPAVRDIFKESNASSNELKPRAPSLKR